MGKKLRRMGIACLLEWQWFLIMRDRKKGADLVDKGISLSSESLVQLSARLGRHATKVMALTEHYEQLTSI